MIKNDEIRYLRLKQAIEEAGSAAALARIAETAPAYISQIVTRKKKQSGKPYTVGNDLARRIEKALRKPEGWMDSSDAGNLSRMMGSANSDKEKQMVLLYRVLQKLSPAQTDRLIALAVEMSLSESE